MKCKILIPIGCRSDEGLSAPIIKRLKQNDNFKTMIFKILTPGDFFLTYNFLYNRKIELDIVFITGDRIEMTAVACWAFHNRVPIVHYYAGILNDPLSTLDDVNRHCISLWSDIQFVESKFCALNLETLFRAIGKTSNCFTVGITHVEDLEIDESKVPEEEYDLVLYNPPTSYNFKLQEKDIKELYQIQKSIKNKAIILYPNPDPKAIFLPVTYPNLPRPQFLGLLKNCERFITNSSAAIYEAPFFLKPEQIIMIGDRNKNRTQFTYKKSDKLASEKIVEILKNWWREKQT